MKIDGVKSMQDAIVIQGAAVAIHDRLTELDFTLGIRSDELIGVGEGQLIETHRLVHGRRPRWNKTGGSKQGKRMANAATALLDILAARRVSLFVARRNLRDLAADADAQAYEAALHASRMRATMDAHEVGQVPDDPEQLIRAISRSVMLNAGHLLDELDAADDVIVDWLHKLGDPAYWKREAAENRRRLEALRGEPLRGHEREVADILDALFSQATPPEHIAATKAIFETGYLNETPPLAA